MLNKNVVNPYVSQNEMHLSLRELELFLNESELIDKVYAVQHDKETL